MRNIKNILVLMLLLFPTVVFASSSNSSSSLGLALFMELFVSIHMSTFVLKPLSQAIAKDDSKRVFWILFFIRAGILLLFDFFITTAIAIFDFIFVFIGAFIIVPIVNKVTKNNIQSNYTSINSYSNNIPTINNTMNGYMSSYNHQNTKTILYCPQCGKMLSGNYKFCPNCGTSLGVNNVQNASAPKVIVTAATYDTMYQLPEAKMVEEFISRALVKAGVDQKSKLIPQDALKRKKILNMIFSVLVFIYISLIFFHLPIITYFVGLLILLIFYYLTRRFNLVKYLVKQVKARPSEKISSIVMNVRNNLMVDNSNHSFLPTLCVAILLPLLIFMNPRILYEKVDEGYVVRFYTVGVTNFTSATIPDTYKGEAIVGLRGNTFSNMFFLKEVNLPDSITEIRGQAFKNDRSLAIINLPSNLEYLGGGSFYNCTSLTHIEMPDTVTYIGGEAFYRCSSLQSVRLSNRLKEIRGNTFEGCTSLTSIDIPDSVTRIGGHAFYECRSLQSVTISPNSQLTEIGSSAFRLCDNLYEIKLPTKVYVNYRAFKESPTQVHRYGSSYNN